jgi:hypothetical protein
MSVTVNGGTAQQKRLLLEAMEVYGRKLMPETYRELDVEIELIRRLYKTEDVKGDMLVIDDEEEFPREFEIRLDSSMHHQALLRALAHEMVHVKQYAMAEIQDCDLRNVLFMGKKYDSSDRTYWDQPWELEAYGRELGLLEHFVKVKKYQNKRWYRDFDYEK